MRQPRMTKNMPKTMARERANAKAAVAELKNTTPTEPENEWDDSLTTARTPPAAAARPASQAGDGAKGANEGAIITTFDATAPEIR